MTLVDGVVYNGLVQFAPHGKEAHKSGYVIVASQQFDIATDSVPDSAAAIPCRRLLLVSDRSHHRWHKNSWINWTAVDSQRKLWTRPSRQLLCSGSGEVIGIGAAWKSLTRRWSI